MDVRPSGRDFPSLLQVPSKERSHFTSRTHGIIFKCQKKEKIKKHYN